MVFFNYATMQMAAKIVYYGPGLCGKTTNLQFIYQKTSPKSRGEMVSLETETDRTLFFDLLPLDVGNIAGFKTRFQLYTVPGQVFYNSTRKLVLRGVDGVVFVADSQTPMMDANIESFSNLRGNLAELGLNIDEIPMVFQWNKRDLKNVMHVEEMNRVLNPRNLPSFEASAIQGPGVFETLKGISKATLIMLRRRALGEEKVKVPEIATKPMPEKPRIATPVPPPAARTMTPPPVVPPKPAVPVKPAASATPVDSPPGPTIAPQPAAVVSNFPPPSPHPSPGISTEPDPLIVKPEIPTAAELATEKVEFSQVVSAASKPRVKKIEVKSTDVALKLDALREAFTGKITTKEKKSAASADPLSLLLGTTEDKGQKVNKKLKIRLEPSELQAIKNLSLDLHLTGGTVHKRFSNALNVNVEGTTNPKRLVLKIEVEILKR